jgi:2,4-didehydro-3-deoxy-L-rhamnonate hydrolase
MKLVRFGNPGAEKPGLVDDQGRLRDLSNVIADLTLANLSHTALRKIAAIAPSTPASRPSACRSQASENSWRSV